MMMKMKKKRRTGFTLVDLVAVLFAAILLVLLPAMLFTGCSISGNRELARRASCKSNISAIAKSLAIYQAVNMDLSPWLTSDDRWDAGTGQGRAKPPSAQTGYNVSALLFMLIRDGQAPGIFVCPSTQDTPDPQAKGFGGYNWDFSPYSAGGVEHLSYSYQAPLTLAKGTTSGVDSNSDAGLLILADRTPTYAGGSVGGTARTAAFPWANPGSADPRAGMSANHTDGEMINLLYADLHVGESIGRADCGINNDNIYSAAGLAPDGKPLATEQGPGSLKLSDHRSRTDSFLLGPKKW